MEKIFTIGYGVLTIDDFIQRLKNIKSHILIDVRSQPYSKYYPDYSKKLLTKYLLENNIEYLYLGNQIGGRPENKEYYNKNGSLNNDLYGKSEGYLNGIKTLVKVLLDKRYLCLMCAEGIPERCHRSRLIAETLFQMGIDVVHILPDGNTIDHKELRKVFTNNQTELFE